MRLILALLLLFPMLASGAVVRLTDCGTLPGSISEGSPFDLDACNLQDGDDITSLLTDIVAEWGAVHVRAPSQTLTVGADYTAFTVTHFSFVEDQSARNRLTIDHTGTNRTLWDFASVDRVLIGGPNLSMTFTGNHPGLGVGEDTEQDGHLTFTQGSVTGELVDIRANFHLTYKSGVMFFGGQSETSATNKIAQVNIAGRFLGSGVNVNGGVYRIWFDPDRTVVMDPWMRGIGWDGAVAGQISGRDVGCSDTARYEYRNFPPAKALFVNRITGGVTLEYGHAIADIFTSYQIGNGAADPFIIRLKDYGFSGPTEITGYPPGVLGKQVGLRTGPIKHDPLWDYGSGLRHIRIQQLPSLYGNGTNTQKIASGCAAGNSTNNDVFTSAGYIWQAEASRDGISSQYVTAYVDVTASGFSSWVGLGTTGEYLKGAGDSPDSTPGPSTPDRTFGHTLRVSGGDSMPGVVTVMDSCTVTGPGTWNTISVTSWVTSPGGTTIYANDNTITDTRVSGAVNISANAENTVIDNVEFTGSARAVITVGAGADVTVTDLCVPNGSSITIASGGSVLYENETKTANYTIPNGTANCNITENPRPDAPGAL